MGVEASIAFTMLIIQMVIAKPQLDKILLKYKKQKNHQMSVGG